jgi:membrane protein YqaA with SNARE-associated domain
VNFAEKGGFESSATLLKHMKKLKLPAWLQHFVAVMGGGGIFLVAFLDSSVLSFPFITDALVMRLCMERPGRTLYYAAMATLGSLAGCIWIYWLAKKGGEAYFHRHGGRAALKAKRWVDDHAFLSLFIPAILPPPMQFKVFVLAEGVFQVPLRTFVLALVLGRGVRYVAEGLFAVKYGQRALDFLIGHAVVFIASVAVLLLVLYIANRLIMHTAPATD